MGEHALPQERRSHKRGRDALGSQFTGSKGQPILYQPRISGRIAARCGVRVRGELTSKRITACITFL